jgi:hypothetical protein
MLVKWFAQKVNSNSREREINCSKNYNSKLHLPLYLPEWFFKLAAHNGLTENFSSTLEWKITPNSASAKGLQCIPLLLWPKKIIWPSSSGGKMNMLHFVDRQFFL